MSATVSATEKRPTADDGPELDELEALLDRLRVRLTARLGLQSPPPKLTMIQGGRDG